MRGFNIPVSLVTRPLAANAILLLLRYDRIPRAEGVTMHAGVLVLILLRQLLFLLLLLVGYSDKMVLLRAILAWMC